ncbi:MAG: hypothetical protein LQ342_006704 [Letrouitia transgressa]|nr:MAG: hypothetical protein LQ342_006704 [Letrouitia transgressa]
MSGSPVPPDQRRRILKVIFISLLLDLISFTFILPLFPNLLEFYRSLESPSTNSLLNRILAALNAYKSSFSRPISSRYDIVLLGGALGSLFSLLQAIASPIIGSLSDKYGRRTALLWSMAGNIFSVALWVAATDFRTFLASRVVGGLSEGNVQLATAMAADISSEEQRGATMALVGACFSIAFTFGPALGAALANIPTVSANPFATAAGFSLLLILVETAYLYLYLPETLPSSKNNKKSPPTTQPQPPKPRRRTNPHWLLNLTHLAFILFFSGLEFSFPFLTHELFAFPAHRTGGLLSAIGLLASAIQATLSRRLPPLVVVRLGTTACALAFFLLSALATTGASELGLWLAAALLAVTTATVVTGLNALSSFEAAEGERGGKLGRHRSWGQLGRGLGPLGFCSLYWWAGRRVAYTVGGMGMLGVAGLVFAALKAPLRASEGKKKKEKEKEKEKSKRG